MLTKETTRHFSAIADTWGQKEWVNSVGLNSQIDDFIRETEAKIGLDEIEDKISLYFGIGPGVLFKYLRRYSVVGIDASAQMLGHCPRGVVQILSNVNDLPFLMDNQFDLTFARNLLKHCFEPELAVEEMYRKTRKGGSAVIAELAPLYASDTDVPTRMVRTTDPSHPRFLTQDEITDMFIKAGFSHVETKAIFHRGRWLSKWIKAEQATPEIRDHILELFRTAPEGFKRRSNVIIQGDEILSTAPWLLLRAYKS